MTYDTSYYEDLRGRARGALIAVAEQVPPKTVGLINELLDSNEHGPAVEALSEAIIEAEATISPETLTSLEGLVVTMGLDRGVAERLRPLVGTSTDRTDG